MELASDEQIVKLSGAPVGYLGPVGMPIRVIADLAMPEMDGREATRRIRAIEADSGQTPVPICAR